MTYYPWKISQRKRRKPKWVHQLDQLSKENRVLTNEETAFLRNIRLYPGEGGPANYHPIKSDQLAQSRQERAK